MRAGISLRKFSSSFDGGDLMAGVAIQTFLPGKLVFVRLFIQELPTPAPQVRDIKIESIVFYH